MKILLDTHFLVWILTGASRLSSYPSLSGYLPWGVSPVALLELQYLNEIGRLQLKTAEFFKTLGDDARFVIDEVPLLMLVRHALPLSWTRDPFDRLLSAHSSARDIPLCTVDRALQAHHRLLVPGIE